LKKKQAKIFIFNEIITIGINESCPRIAQSHYSYSSPYENFGKSHPEQYPPQHKATGEPSSVFT
jgi:hypothetical protein